MECPTCHFQNLPRLTTCGRCGGPLVSDLFSVNVYPRRAGRLSRVLRRWLPVRRWWYRLVAFLRPAPLSIDLLDARGGLFLRIFVPGWLQIYGGAAQRGRWWLACYLLLLGFGVWTVGSTPGNLCITAALAVHFTSVVEVIAAGTRRLRQRLAYSAACVATLLLLVYFPVAALLEPVASVRQVQFTAGPVSAGDVFLVRSRDHAGLLPAPGEVVFYFVPAARRAVVEQNNHLAYQIEGPNIDRVLAGPGQTVEYAAGVLKVDGRPSAWLPFDLARVPFRFQKPVPQNRVFILPGNLPNAFRVFDGEHGWEAAFIPAENIYGKVYMHRHSWWRWSKI